MVKIYFPKILLPFLFAIFFAALFFTGCKKNSDDISSIDNPPDLTTKVRSSVSGFVTDEYNMPLTSATVQVGTSTVITDKYGYFEIKNVEVIQQVAVVTVTRPGYFKGIKTYIAEDGKAAFFRIKLMPKTNAGTINGTTGGIVTLTNGLSINLPANAVVNATTNTSYTGTVNVSAHWLDPTAADLSSKMPGDLRGVNTDGNLKLLTTYGMAAVELTGSSGELLQIATGKKATLNFPIPSSISPAAPASIPLWYFDESNGLWKEEGNATKNGNNYVGEVSHFSFWNCDVPGSFVQLSATLITDYQNNPMQYAKVKISVVGNPANFRYGYTDVNGYVIGAVPSNTQLLFEVYGNVNCTTPVYSQNVTTSTTNISLGTIIISSSVNNLAIITGTVVDCSNALVTNGYVMVWSGTGYSHFTLSNTGTYTGIFSLCSSTSAPVTIIAEDLGTHMTGSPVAATVVQGNNTITTIQVCSTIQQEYVNITKNGVSQNYQFLLVLGNASNYGIGFYSNATLTVPAGNFQFSQTGIAMGSLQDLTYLALGSSIMGIPNPVKVNITEYGAIGQYVAGNFSSNFIQPPSNTPITISCDFRVKRLF